MSLNSRKYLGLQDKPNKTRYSTGFLWLPQNRKNDANITELTAAPSNSQG